MMNLSFVQAGFLFAGLAALIPIAIHLLLKQRARKVDIGSVRFLQIVLKEHNRMRRIRQWLLLAARIVTALLLALLFARPFIDQTALEAGQREIVYLLDRSASMQLEKDGATLFDTAYDDLVAEIGEVHEETVVHVALFDTLGITEIPWQDTPDVAPSFAATNFAKALDWGRNVLLQSSRPQKEIVIFTDLQQAGLEGDPPIDFPDTIEVHIRDYGKAISNNLSISRAEASAVEIRPEMPPVIEVEVANGSPIVVEGIDVSIALRGPDGSKVSQTKQIDIPAADRATARFEISDAVEGVYQGEVTLQHDDDLEIDNRRFVALRARRPDRILLVDGQEGSSLYSDETYYLQTAIAVGEEHSNRDVPSYEVERIVWDNGKGFPDLSGFRAIVMANVGSFTDQDANRLKGFLNDSGRVIFFCGDQFSRRAAKPLAAAGVLPGSIEGTASIGPYRIGSWDQEHPIFAPFADPQYGDLRTIRFAKLALLGDSSGLAGSGEDSVKVLVSTSSGMPVLLEHIVGQQSQPGKVLLWASTADTQWTSWPQGRLFVPVIRQLLAYVTDHHLNTDGIREVIASQDPGIRTEENHIVVANMDPLESDLVRMTPEQFRESLNLPETKEFSDLTPSELAQLAPPEGSLRPEEIWSLIAWILVGWLLLETFLAGRVHA